MSDTGERQFGDLMVVIYHGTCIATENYLDYASAFPWSAARRYHLAAST